MVRSCAARALGGMGQQAEAAIPALKEALKDGEWEVQVRAALALSLVAGSKAQEAVPILCETMEYAWKSEQKDAARALGMIGLRTNETLRVLYGALKDRESEVREEAREALKRIDPEAARKVPDQTTRLIWSEQGTVDNL